MVVLSRLITIINYIQKSIKYSSLEANSVCRLNYQNRKSGLGHIWSVPAFVRSFRKVVVNGTVRQVFIDVKKSLWFIWEGGFA